MYKVLGRCGFEFKKLYRRWACLGNPNDIEHPYQMFLRQQAVAAGVDLTLSWIPGANHYYLPFITTVWDMGHRVHPYFPELATNGEWERREKMYQYLPRATKILTGTQTCKD